MRRQLVIVLMLVAGAGCGSRMTNAGVSGGGGANPGGNGGNGGSGPKDMLDPGTPVTVAIPSALTSAAATVLAALAGDRPADAAGFLQRWNPTYLAQLPYDPAQATGLATIQASTLQLNDVELAILSRNGFAISTRQRFPTFFDGYKAIYAAHLPLYVSLDSVLHAVHRSYDAALMDTELDVLAPDLGDLLSTLHAGLAAGAGVNVPANVRADVDLFLTVARLLLGQSANPVAGADPAAVSALVSAAKNATGLGTVTIFGEERTMDFSQFTPRGHYASSAELTAYFQSMMWLGRTDFRFLQFDTFAPPPPPPRFVRRQFLAGLLLASLAEGAPLQEWQTIDGLILGFVGESDNMTIADFTKLAQAAHVAAPADLVALPDQQLAQALLDGGFGIQRIASQILFVPPGGAGVSLDRVFLFFGQRFVIDSEVLSNVVFDRVRSTSTLSPDRMMPNPLDAAFAALGNTAAAPLLASELSTYQATGYPSALSDARQLVDQHGDDFWGESLYGLWMSALRGLSAPGGDPTMVAGLPSVARTEPWARRVLNTQLASWAELRHDTLLYAKQSYTGIPTCEFPDAYVDPYPDAWAAVVRLARLGQQIARQIPSPSGSVGPSALDSYFSEVATDAGILRDMATAELAGQDFTAAQMAFINQAVDATLMSAGCTQVLVPTGWYPRLFLNRRDVTLVDPTIADVHTDPVDKLILHVATELPRLMVVTVDACTGPRAYAGLASAYHEKTTTGLVRLADQTWATEVMQTPPPADVPWMTDLLGP